jgi:hypothetical protein
MPEVQLCLRGHARTSENVNKQKMCRACKRADTNRWRERNPDWKLETPEHRKRRHRLQRYGITPEQYDAIFEFQGRACAICRTTVTNRWAVDHCHKTQKTRAILCFACNTAIGLLRESPNIMMKAMAYIAWFEKNDNPALTEAA